MVTKYKLLAEKGATVTVEVAVNMLLREMFVMGNTDIYVIGIYLNN